LTSRNKRAAWKVDSVQQELRDENHKTALNSFTYFLWYTGLIQSEYFCCLDKEDRIMRDYSNIARKITRTLFFSQSIVTAGLIAIATVNSIAGADLSGVPAWAGIPSTVVILAAA
jgi:hypothetical protein